MLGDIREARLWLVNLAWWAAILILAGLTVANLWWGAALLTAALLPFAAALAKTRSPSRALFTVASWNVFTLGFVVGLLRGRTSPTAWIASNQLA